jgi:hypothetical protein
LGGTVKLSKELEKALEARNLAAQKRSFKQEKFRAQSVMVGKVGAGATEMSLRGMDGGYLFIVLHPPEVIELIHQLAANTGCTVNITPRKDFASYRAWPNSSQAEEGGSGHSPHAEFTAGFEKIGLRSAVTNNNSATIRKENESTKETMAASKPSNTSRAKRSGKLTR